MDGSRPADIILHGILSQLRRLTLAQLLVLLQAISEELNDRHTGGFVQDTYDPSGYTDESEASDGPEAMNS